MYYNEGVINDFSLVWSPWSGKEWDVIRNISELRVLLSCGFSEDNDETAFPDLIVLCDNDIELSETTNDIVYIAVGTSPTQFREEHDNVQSGGNIVFK